MALLEGCQDANRTPEMVEVLCPECGEILEVFIEQGGFYGKTGTTVGEVKCEKCGHVIEEMTYLDTLEKA